MFGDAHGHTHNAAESGLAVRRRTGIDERPAAYLVRTGTCSLVEEPLKVLSESEYNFTRRGNIPCPIGGKCCLRVRVWL